MRGACPMTKRRQAPRDRPRAHGQVRSTANWNLLAARRTSRRAASSVRPHLRQRLQKSTEPIGGRALLRTPAYGSRRSTRRPVNQFEKVHRVRFKISIPGDHEGDAAPYRLRNSRKRSQSLVILSDRDRSSEGSLRPRRSDCACPGLLGPLALRTWAASASLRRHAD